MSQFITIQVGQCGNQIGSAFWPLALHEYGIDTANTGMNLLKIQRNYIKNLSDLSDAFHSFFFVPDNRHDFCFKTVNDLRRAKVKARAILIDMEDSVVGGLKRGPLRDLFDQKCTVTNYPGCGNNWAVGYHTYGNEYHEKLEDAIRLTVEKCSQLHGFLILHSLGGGTGSGLGTAVLKLLADNYPVVDRLVSCIYPTAMQDVVTAPYNALLATQELIEHATCVFPIENTSLLDICNAQLRKKENINQLNYNISCKPFQDMNSIIVNMLLHLTRLIDELFADAWSRNNQLIKVDPLQADSKVLSAAHIVRGNCFISDLKRNIEKFQRKSTCTEWSRDAMKIGLCSVPPAGHSTSLLCLLNSSSMSLLFKNIIKQFVTLYKRKAHVYHYTQVRGFEEAHFVNSKEIILNLIARYTELENQRPTSISRLQII
ncbi:tubulin epsilon chain isoform X2 [Osmia lignaria lignaria]|uniref:tubulin epsilon chain isoform X2 n=1 Tax=Osmia lignaria lignaria TaxID=1437193 RepID=UPI001479668F|nr:tubulin epsilon chain-like isoform X3 [Osmia lignaria]